jgi:hypothetical protein
MEGPDDSLENIKKRHFEGIEQLRELEREYHIKKQALETDRWKRDAAYCAKIRESYSYFYVVGDDNYCRRERGCFTTCEKARDAIKVAYLDGKDKRIKVIQYVSDQLSDASLLTLDQPL